MPTLRASLSRTTRLVLAWFLLTLGVAIASPIVHPRAMELVCSDGQALKLVIVGEEGAVTGPLHQTLDCAACLAIAPPVPLATVDFERPHPLSHALHPIEAGRIASLVGAPLPPRGPPALVA